MMDRKESPDTGRKYSFEPVPRYGFWLTLGGVRGADHSTFGRRREEVSKKLTVLVATSRTDASPLSNTVVWFDLTLQPVIGSSPSSAVKEGVAGEDNQSHEHNRSEHGSKK